MSTKENKEIEKLKREIIKKNKLKEKNKAKKKEEDKKNKLKEEKSEKEKVKKEKDILLKEKEEIEKENKEEEDYLFKRAMSNFRRRYENKEYHIFSILTIIICISISIILIYFAANRLSDKVYKNVYLGKHYVGNLTEKELEDKIIEIYQEENLKIIVTVKQGEEIIDRIAPQDIDISVDIPETKRKVINFGRDANIFINNLNIFKALINKKVIDFSYKYDEEKLKNEISVMQTSVKGRAIDDKYEINGSKLLITKGKDGKKIDEEKMKNSIDKLFSMKKNSEYQIETQKEKAKRIDVDILFREVFREPKDAQIVKHSDGSVSFEKEVVGLGFDKNKLKAELEKLEPEKTLEFALDVTEPKVKYEDIKWEGYKDVLGSKTTYFPSGIYARSINLRTALSYLNGVVIMPGEVFSYNKIIGNPTSAKGYKPAATFKGGIVVNEVGGGICQTVSTLYNAALYANLPIIERHAHGLAVGYVKPSLDATMYYPVKDLKFKNNRKYPIKIVTYFSPNGNLTVKILGTREANDPEIILESKMLSTRKFGTTYVNDRRLAKGRRVVRSAGVIGYTSISYKITKRNGVIVDRVVLSKDTYKPTNKIVAVGTR